MRKGLGIRARVLIVALLSASFVGGNVASPPPAEAVVTSLEYQLARYHNNARKARGLKPLVIDTTLSDKARRHTRAMISKGYLFHSSSLPRAYGVGEGAWRYLGENVGYASSVLALHNAFMKSYGHRKNILSRSYKRMGIGIVRSGSRYWVTVAFIG